MSVIAWDGKAVAADRMAVIADVAIETTKIWKMPDGIVIATTGDFSFGLAMIEWWKAGADAKEWPPFQQTDDWARLIIFEPGERPYCYERQPCKQPIFDRFAAWGCGRDLALGAMAMGANAVKAVEIASQFNIYCGKGVDCYMMHSDQDSPMEKWFDSQNK